MLVSDFLRNGRTICSRARSQPPTAEYSSEGNPGMNVELFKALLRKPGSKYAQRRYQLRWDWHLRNFLMALIPPAVLYAVLSLVDLKFKKEGIKMSNIIVEKGNEEKNKLEDADGVHTRQLTAGPRTTFGQFGAEERLKLLEQQVGTLITLLEEQVAQGMEQKLNNEQVFASGKERVLAASSVARQLVRPKFSPCKDDDSNQMPN